MAREKIVTIGNYDFKIRRLDAFTALEVFGDLQKELLPAIGTLTGEDGDAAIKAIEKVSGYFTGKQLRVWADRLITPDEIFVSRKGEDDYSRLNEQRREEVFTDAVQILELLVEIIKENFADPLTQWLTRSGLANKLKVAKLENSEKK